VLVAGGQKKPNDPFVVVFGLLYGR
jgi:hypothetical protein